MNESLAHQNKVIERITRLVPPAEWKRKDQDLFPSDCHSEPYIALYINLDESIDRRQSIERELSTLGIKYHRIPGVKEMYGMLGCLKSHIKALRIAASLPIPWVAIFEDDFSFSASRDIIRQQIEFLMSHPHMTPVWLGAWMINGPMPARHPEHQHLRIANGACNTASCYFIRHDYIETLMKTWERALEGLVADLKRYATMKREGKIDNVRANLWKYDPDCAWAPLQLRDKWFLFDPSLGFQKREQLVSTLVPSMNKFDETGYREIDLSQLTCHID